MTDEGGNPVVGAAVYLKSDPSKGVTTDANGKFNLTIPAGQAVLVFSFIGMEQQEVGVTASRTTYNVTLKGSSTDIGAVSVVSTGLFTRDKVTYTGNISTFSGEELRTVSSRNILESLSVLDPSFIMIEDINAGSNPNSMKGIEVRGGSTSSLSAIQDEFSADPNQPLFILNGVEVPYSRIHDLDPYRVESINVLKDAGATSIYGAKGANGVIVFELIKPKPGQYTVSYNGQFSVDAPDLTVYNMMNSAEKLEFERLAGKYWRDSWASTEMARYNMEYQKLYNHFAREIANGVDTYWMNEPVRTAFSNKHGVSINGGTEELALTVGLKYNNIQGVMKNNDRRSWGADATIEYRVGKFIIVNYTDINGYNAKESNYGSFADWVNASPYYRKYNADGGIDKWLLTTDGLGSISGLMNSSAYDQWDPIAENVPNPLWNASLRSKNEREVLYINNNFMAQYDITPHLRAKAKFNVRREQTQSVNYLDPDHTSFADTDRYKKGTLKNYEAKSTAYNGELALNYGRSFDKHMLGGNAYVQLTQTKNRSLTTEVEGFPRGSDGSPDLAHSYKTESRPAYGWAMRREVGALFTANYSYDLRYLFDVTFRTDGATTFGSNELFSPFWSVGLGWNLQNEKFASGWNNVDILRFTTSYGTTGNQNIGQVASTTLYKYYVESNIFGQGSFLDALGAPDLPWAVNRKFDTKLELRLFAGRLSMTGGYYYDKTKPQIVDVDQIPSTGLVRYPIDIGYLTQQGVEFSLTFFPIHNVKDRILWSITLNGSYKDSEYGGFGNALETLNNTMIESNQYNQYRDGYSPSTLWAVQSYGIDPATGQELFVNLDGTLTYKYDASQRQPIGNSRPSLEGNIHTSFRYRNFYVSASLNYSLGSDIYNDALYNKVENISRSSLEKNQDKRALYDRWKTPGDVAKFRSIMITDIESPRTSRFIQKNNYLRAVAINMGYELNRNPWLKRHIGVERMSFNFTMNELFRLETSKYERGIVNPFARQFMLGVNVGF